LDQEIGPDDMALLSLCTGVASLILSMGPDAGRRLQLALLGGAVAVSSGWLAARNECRHQKQAITGIICGVIGLCTYLLR
jgi:hypothetical protein